MNTLVIEKQTGGYFKFTLNGDTANAITSIQNDLLAVGTQLHFKTGNGANIIKEQFIYPADVTIIASGTFTFTTVAQVWDKLIDIDYFAWLGGGGTGGVDRFDDLLDTFSYTGNAGKAVVVDGSELRLVPITLYNKRLFTELEDTPSSLVPNKMLVVNPAGTAVVLQDQPEQPEQLLNSVGYFDYNDLITQTTPLNAVANVALKLTNDTEGANTSTDQNPYGVSYVWDYTTNAFNFSELEVGDTIDVRVHVQVTTTSANQRVLLSAKFGIGSIAEFTNIIYENQFKSAGLHEINFVAPFYMGSTYITDNPAELYLTTDSSATVKVDGWYVRILRKNINIITVDYTVPDATTTVKGIVRLAGDLAGTANSPTVPELANKVPTSRTVSTTSPLLGGGALSSNLTLSIQQANSVDSGYLSNVDWSTFNGKANDNAVVKLTGDQTISGVKTFSNPTIFNSSLNIASGAYSILYNPANSAYWQTYVDSSNVFNFGYNGNIVKASISNSGNFTANSFIKSGGTSSQFLKADGSVDSSTYALTSQLHDAVTLGTTGVLNGLSLSGQVLSLATASSTTRGALTAEDYSYFFGKQNALTNPITGTGTTNYLPKFTGTSAIGNSLIFDNGTNVGIGTNSPDQKLTVIGNVRAGGVGNGFLLDTLGVNFTNGMKVVNNYETVMFSGRGSSGYVIAGDNNLRFGFGTNYSAGESMLITSSGNVGIGTTSPAKKLHVKGGNDDVLFLDNGGERYTTQYFANNGTTKSFLVWDNTSSLFEIGTAASSDLRLLTNNAERMRITSGGNVGIGTTSPSQKLVVDGGTADFMPIFAKSSLLSGGKYFGSLLAGYQTDVSKSAQFGYVYDSSNIANSYAHITTFGASEGSQFAIKPNGNVGIGTTSPISALQVGAGTVSSIPSYVKILSTGSSDTGIASAINNKAIYLYNNGSTLKLDAYDYSASAALDVQIGGNGGKILLSGGNVGIGTTSPSYKLDVNGSARFSGDAIATGVVFAAGTGGFASSTYAVGVRNPIWRFGNADGYGLSYFQGTAGIGGSDTIGFHFGTATAAASQIQFISNGSAVFAGSVTAASGFFNSDIRLKDLTDYDYNVSDIKPITYLWKDGRDNKKHVGYSAQEVQKVMPDAVNEGTDGMLSVNYVEVLVAKIAELENRIKQLEK